MFLNLLLGIITVGVTVLIQGYGTYFWLERLRIYRSRLEKADFRKKTVKIIILTACFIIILHLIQAGLWATLYVAIPGVDEFQSFEKAMYFSLVTFTTLGYGEITIDSSNRILAGLEALNGIILVGWSTALMFSIFLEILKGERMYKN